MIVREIIKHTYQSCILYNEDEYIREDLESISLPVWDELSLEEKIASLTSIYENCDKRADDYTHSGCCTAVEQATCAFCIQWFKNQDLLGCLMDDCDFMMASHIRNDPKIKKLFGIQ